MPKPLFISLLIAVPILLAVALGGPGFFLGLAIVLIANPVIWKVRKERYF